VEQGAFSFTRNQRLAVAATAVLIALTRFMSLSLAPWDWDEVLFCLALGDYNVAAHYPHPPGFPLYVFLGRIARLFADTDFHALQTVNVLAGMAAFPVVFWLARSFRMDFHGAYASGVLFAFLPNVWFYGGTGFSDLPAAVFYLAAIAAYMSAMGVPRSSSGSSSSSEGGPRNPRNSEEPRGTRQYLLASVLFAAGILIRPQNAPVTVFPWTITTVKLLRAKQWRAVIAGSIVLVLLVALGYGISMVATGVDQYIIALTNHSTYVKHADSVKSVARAPLWEVALIQLDPYEAGKAALLMNALALVAIIGGRRRMVVEILLTWAPFFIFAMLVVNPLGASRFALNYMAGLVLLSVEGAAVLGRLAARFHPRAGFVLRAAAIAAVVVRLATWTPEAFEVPRTTIPPPTAAAMWIDRNVPRDKTVFVDGNIWPWVHYFAPDHKRIRPRDEEEIILSSEAEGGWYISNAPTSATTAVTFLRPRTRTWNIVTKRAFESYVLPTAHVVKFGRGWYGQEGLGRDSWRWAAQRSFMLLGPIEGNAELRLRFAVPLEMIDQPASVTFTLNGTHRAVYPLTKNENEVRYIVPARGNAPNFLRIEVSDSFVPADHGEPDQRELAFMLRSWRWQPERASARARP
jgi:hypothetical protein